MKSRDSTPDTMPVRMAPDPAAHRAWLDARRRSHAERMTALHAPTYDEHWGEIMPSHFDGVGYHHFPETGQVHAWLVEAGLEILDERLGDDYLHLLARRPG